MKQHTDVADDLSTDLTSTHVKSDSINFTKLHNAKQDGIHKRMNRKDKMKVVCVKIIVNKHAST